jgi:transglutaminase/protease-like cytokinesis protein 3
MNHSWNAVVVEGVFYLLDATWAAGNADLSNPHGQFVFNFSDYFFCTPPDQFIYTHFPFDLVTNQPRPCWQLLGMHANGLY